ncbi:MAG: DUF3318 domain-containing protein [Burkholderiaceae bacterium]|nr:DUF3318 domain-containing protein [Burkholderiaceae bacterium]
MSDRLPLAYRRQLLLTRAAVERVELHRALDEFRSARRPAVLAAEMLFRLRGAAHEGGVAGLLMQGLALFRQYPYLGSALSLALGATRRGAGGRLLRRAGVLAALAAAGAWAITAVARDRAPPPSNTDHPQG